MKKFIDFCCRRNFSTASFFISIIICAIYSFKLVKIDFLPQLELPYFIVHTQAEGLNSDDVEKLVTLPLEKGLQSLSNLKEISSNSSFENSEIFVKLHWDTNPQKAILEIINLTDTIFTQLPNQAQRPQVTQLNPSERPVFSFAIIPKESDIYTVSTFTKNTIIPELSRIEGTGIIQSLGLRYKDISLEFDEKSLIDAQGIISQINNNNFLLPAGKIQEGDIEKSISIDNRIKNIAEVRELVYKDKAGQIKFEDFLDITEKSQKNRDFFIYENTNGISLFVYKSSRANPTSTTKLIKQYLQTLSEDFSNLFEVKILNDRSVIIKEVIRTLLFAGLTGAICIFFIIFFFYKSISTTLIIILPIPIALICTTSILTVLGRTINIISLSGMLTSLGMLVDNTMIISENILRLKKIPDYKAIAKQVYRPAFSTLSSTITTIIVFLPAAILPGIAGMLFTDLVLAISISLTLSWLVSISLVPALFTIFKPEFIEDSKHIETYYYSFVKYFFKNPKLITIIISLSIVLIIPSSLIVKKEIAQELKQTQLDIIVDYNKNPEQEIKIINYHDIIRKLKLKTKLKESFTISDARAENLSISSYSRSNKQLISIKYDGKKKTLKTIKDEINKINQDNEDMILTILPYSTILTQTLGAKQGTNEFIITGDNEYQVHKNQDAFLEIIGEENLIKEFNNFEYILLKPNMQKLKLAEINIEQLASLIKLSLDEINITTIYNSLDEQNIFLKNKTKYHSLENLKIKANNQEYFIKNLCEIEQKQTSLQNFRYNNKSAKLLVTKNNKFKISKNLEIEDINKNNIKEFLNEFILLIFLAVVILFLCLCTSFESIKNSLIISISIPFSILGGIIFLIISNNSLNLFSLTGLLVLTGSSINSSILLIDEYSGIKGEKTIDKILETSFLRSKAVFLSYLTTVIALFPSFLMIPSKTDQSASAAVLIGGLSFCLFSTLVITPLLYFFDNNRSADNNRGYFNRNNRSANVNRGLFNRNNRSANVKK